MLRCSATRVAARVAARPHLRTPLRSLAGGPGYDLLPPPRTPERTAELEKLAEEHNGFLFGELPLKPGEVRVKEDWEAPWVYGMTFAFALYGVAYYFRPKHSLEEWARVEALKRMAAKANGEGEDDEDDE